MFPKPYVFLSGGHPPSEPVFSLQACLFSQLCESLVGVVSVLLLLEVGRCGFVLKTVQGCVLKASAAGAPCCTTHHRCMAGCSVPNSLWLLGSASAWDPETGVRTWSRAGWTTFLIRITVSLGCHTNAEILINLDKNYMFK